MYSNGNLPVEISVDIFLCIHVSDRRLDKKARVNYSGSEFSVNAVEQENKFFASLFCSIQMRRGWKASPSSWTGMYAAFNVGFDKDATRKNPAPLGSSVRACKDAYSLLESC